VQPDGISSKKINLILLFIILFGAFLAFGGANWGLPVLLHPDEWSIVDPAMKMVHDRSLVPDIFRRPDHLLIQINAMIYRVMLVIKGVPAESIYDVGIEVFHFAARIVTGCFAVGSILISYLVGKRYSVFVGLISAFLFAVFPLYVKSAHIVTSDIPTVFFMLLFVHFALNYMRKPALPSIALMALMTAAFTTIKYSGTILCGMIAITVIVSGIVEKKRIRILKHGIASLLFVILFIFLISPVLYFRFDDVIQAFAVEARGEHLGADGLGFIGNMLFYVNTYITTGGMILLIFFIFGCYALFSDRRKLYYYLPLLSGLFYWICLSYVPLHWDRWALPMYVTPLIISAVGISKFCKMILPRIKTEGRQRTFIVVVTAVFCLSAVNLITSSIGNLTAAMLPDTRVASQQYTEENNIDKDNTAYDGYTTFQPNTAGRAILYFDRINDTYYLGHSRINNILVSGEMFERYRNEPERYADEVLFYDSLEEYYTEAMRFGDVPRASSMIDAINIANNISYISGVKDKGMAGPILIFYKAATENRTPYYFSSEILFSEGNTAYHRFLISGLSEQEESGVWTEGSETEFLFFLSETKRDLDLEFKVKPLTGGNLTAQTVEITANGVSLGKLEIRETGTYNVMIPNRTVSDKVLDLKFLLHTAVSPKELQIGEDDRTLGLFFYEMTVDEKTG